MWKMIILYAPLLGATLIGGALTIDEYHNWYDVFAGAVIGTVMAFSAYRMVYAAIWDWRFNHIPMHRGQAFMYGGDMDGVDALWTRKAGWGLSGHGHYKNGVGHGHHGKHAAGNSDAGLPRKPVPSRPVGHGDEMV
jgi:diacylglycerol diphosphate phosphatase / phosphatidate phosphatase